MKGKGILERKGTDKTVRKQEKRKLLSTVLLSHLTGDT